VSQHGETLSDWARRLEPSVPVVVQALAAIADRLAALHACGYVYYALKASDVVWLETHQEWQLADFGAALKAGAKCTCAARDSEMLLLCVSFADDMLVWVLVVWP
jgi:hypothetical protein